MIKLSDIGEDDIMFYDIETMDQVCSLHGAKDGWRSVWHARQAAAC